MVQKLNRLGTGENRQKLPPSDTVTLDYRNRWGWGNSWPRWIRVTIISRETDYWGQIVGMARVEEFASKETLRVAFDQCAFGRSAETPNGPATPRSGKALRALRERNGSSTPEPEVLLRRVPYRGHAPQKLRIFRRSACSRGQNADVSKEVETTGFSREPEKRPIRPLLGGAKTLQKPEGFTDA
jgi:hypothetical protein